MTLRTTLVWSILLISAASAEARHCETPSSGSTSSKLGRDLFIVAHPDDDLIFMNPEILSCIRAGHTVQTVYLTAADAGRWWPYWKDREAGVRSAYAQMAGATNSWTTTEVLAGMKQVRTIKLNASGVTLIFLGLPDGNRNGKGNTATGFRSLRKLWLKPSGSAITIDGSNS